MEVTQKTLPALFEARCRLSPNRTAAFYLDEDNSWQPINWAQYLYSVNQISNGLQKLSIRKGDCVAIMAPTSLNWEFAQMSALAVGCVVAGIDQNYPTDQMEYVFNLLNPTVLFVQDAELLSKIPPAVQERIKVIVLFKEVLDRDRERSLKALFFSSELKETINSIPTSQDEAIIVFSSGTTGMPKAICYTQEQVIIAIDAISNIYPDLNEDTVLFCWLPLANLFQRIVNFCAVKIGATNYFLSNPRDLMAQIKYVNPHILIGVPKIFIKIQNAILQNIQEKKKPLSTFLSWILSYTRKNALARLNNYDCGKDSRNISLLLDFFVVSRIRRIFGSRLKYLISGSAPMPLWLLEWYEGIGLPVFEAYGVSENIVPIAMNHPSDRRLGSVGKPLASSKIELAADGEVLIAGSGVMKRYWSRNQASIVKQTISQDFWHTNDLGHFDENGFLFLSGRKSEVIKTAEGKWISPAKIEEQFLYLEYIDQSFVFRLSNGKIAAILCINQEKYHQKLKIYTDVSIDASYINNTNEYTRVISLDIKDVLKQLPYYQHPRGIIITTQQFTIDGGELTTNMKLRRSVIMNHFSLQINSLESGILNSTIDQRGRSSNYIEPILLII